MTKLRRDSFCNRLCIHCGGALDAQMTCRQCNGHVVGKPQRVPEVTLGSGGALTLTLRVPRDTHCEDCGYFVCSCKPPGITDLEHERQAAHLTPRVERAALDLLRYTNAFARAAILPEEWRGFDGMRICTAAGPVEVVVPATCGLHRRGLVTDIEPAVARTDASVPAWAHIYEFPLGGVALSETK